MISRPMRLRSQRFGMQFAECAITRAMLATLWCSLLIGCTGDWGAGKDAVLLDSTATIGAHPLPMRLVPPIRSEGDVSVCLVLASGVRYDDRARVDMKYREMLRGAQPVALLRGVDGRDYRFSEPRQSWTEYGRVTKGGELSSCLAPEKGSFPGGVEIGSVELTSDVPLKILGIYWNSVRSL